MTFSRIKSVGWVVNEKVTSGQLNQLDLDHFHSLDKTGDNLTNSGGITGRVDVINGGTFELQTGSVLNVHTGSQVSVNGGAINVVTGTQTFNNTSGVNFNDSSSLTFGGSNTIIVGSSASELVAGTLNITSGGTLGLNNGATMHVKAGATETVDSGGNLTVAAGGFLNLNNCVSTVNNGLFIVTASGAIVTSGTGFITVASGGGLLQVTGGTLRVQTGTFRVDSGVTSLMGDFPVFIAAKTRQMCESPLDGGPGASTWGFGGQFVYSTGATGGYWIKNLNRTHNGATLNQLFVNFSVNGSRSVQPATLPSLSVVRYLWTAMFSPQTLSTTDPQYFPNLGSGAAYYAGGAQHFMNYVCNQNNVIDNTNYVYVLFINDEGGANSFNGNAYGTITMEFQVIPDLSWNI